MEIIPEYRGEFRIILVCRAATWRVTFPDAEDLSLVKAALALGADISKTSTPVF